MQAQNSCSSPSIKSLFGANGFSGLRKSFFTGGRLASWLEIHPATRVNLQESRQECGLRFSGLVQVAGRCIFHTGPTANLLISEPEADLPQCRK